MRAVCVEEGPHKNAPVAVKIIKLETLTAGLKEIYVRGRAAPVPPSAPASVPLALGRPRPCATSTICLHFGGGGLCVGRRAR